MHTTKSLRTSFCKILLLAALVAFLTPAAHADTLYVSNIVSGVVTSFDSAGTGSIVTNAGLDQPVGLAFDATGNLFVSNFNGNYITKITPTLAQSIVIDNTTLGSGPHMDEPTGLAFDSLGNLYIANIGAGTIIQVTPGGVGSLYASAGLNTPIGLAFGPNGHLFVANTGQSPGLNSGSRFIEEIFSAGSSVDHFYAGLSIPFGIAFSPTGDLFVANLGNNTIEKINVTTGVTSTFASGAAVNVPTGVAFDSAGTLYVANAGNNTIYKFDSAGTPTLFAQNVGGDLNQPRLLAFAPEETTATPLPATFWNGLTMLALCGPYPLLRRLRNPATRTQNF